MTKEKIKNFVVQVESIREKQGYIGMHNFIDEFFSSNVCIPRGENRHPYADVLHKWIEDSSLTLECWIGGDRWEVSQLERNLYPDTKYRIKPQEPVYEYLWLDLRTPDDFYCPTNKYMTELEAEAYFRPSHTWFKVLETKRIRE